ncbi:hypothetical protein APHAL10511_008104 [Amanita phalloides]|nr:hypothetical protein APHAL10511_008104 [Amanita phalloides]
MYVFILLTNDLCPSSAPNARAGEGAGDDVAEEDEDPLEDPAHEVERLGAAQFGAELEGFFIRGGGTRRQA